MSYDNYDSFGEKFGHLFYTKQKFKNYHLKLDYRFYGEHANKFKNEDEAWNYKNSGVMLHSEHPKQMFLNQGFPVSIEGQFLGGSGIKERPTLNMCSPGTEVDINGSQAVNHCISSSSNTYQCVALKRHWRTKTPRTGGARAEPSPPEWRKDRTSGQGQAQANAVQAVVAQGPLAADIG